MQFTKIVALQGPNRWSRSPILEAWVDAAAAPLVSREQLDRLRLRLAECMPNCAAALPLMDGPTDDPCAEQAAWLGAVAAELVAMSGPGEKFGGIRALPQRGLFAIAIAAPVDTLARACLKTANEFYEAALANEAFEFGVRVKQLRDLYDTVCLGPSTRAIWDAARARGIPTFRLNLWSAVQLGMGAKQRRIMTAESDRTSAIAESISQDKQLTRRLLQSMGVPVPEGRTVDSPEDAWEAAQEIGAPVVVKPLNGNHGRGVFMNLQTRDEILVAYDHAIIEGDGVIVEQYIPGAEHRVLVVGDRVVAATRGEIASVVGNGILSVEQLVEEQLNSDPRRGDEYATPLAKIEFNPVILSNLQRQGLTVQSIPADGRTVLIQQIGNLSIDVTDEVHPEVAARAIEAARAIGLDIAGIDIVITDISRPMEEQRAAVVEVNAGPGLQMHLLPSKGKPRPVGEAIVATLFPPGESGRIPVVGVTGHGSASVTRLVAHLLAGERGTVGMSLPEGIWIGNRRIETTGLSRGAALRNILINPGVEAAVLEISPSMVLDEGLVIEDCDVAIVLDGEPAEGNGRGQQHDDEQHAELIARLLVEAVRDCGAAVLPSHRADARALAKACRGEAILCGNDAVEPAFAEFRAGGGHAVFVENKRIVASKGHQQHAVASLSRLALLSAGHAMRQEHLLAAAGAALFLGMPAGVIGDRMASFLAGGALTAPTAASHSPQSVPA